MWYPHSCGCALDFNTPGNDPKEFKEAVTVCTRHRTAENVLETVMTENQYYSQLYVSLIDSLPNKFKLRVVDAFGNKGVSLNPKRVQLAFNEDGELLVNIEAWSMTKAKAERIATRRLNEFQPEFPSAKRPVVRFL